jgi:hypothetical protein
MLDTDTFCYYEKKLKSLMKDKEIFIVLRKNKTKPITVTLAHRI